MPGYLHSIAERRLMNDIPGLQTRGFKRMLRKELAAEEIDDTIAKFWRIRPDAYRVAPAPGRPHVTEIHVYEVEDTHPIGEEKMRTLLDMWWVLDATCSHELRVYVVDRYGEARELDMTALAYAAIAAERDDER